jgi:hypothetical protein
MWMTNYLKMPKKSQVLALLELGWSQTPPAQPAA